MISDVRVSCNFCEGGKRVINLIESNKHFISKRIIDGNIDEAITISRIAWDNFPKLKESADTKKIVETLLEGVQETINAQIFTPISTSISGLNALMSMLEKNPELIQKCSNETIQNLSGQLSQIVSSINGPMIQIQQMLSQLIYKPSVKGSVGERVLAELWPGDFEKDLIEMLGGAGREDFLVTPYLNTGFNRYGDRISVERKSGKQKYTGAHFEEAVRHSIERGATFSIIIYDAQESILQQTMITREKDVLVAVADIESGTWKIAREMFEFLQIEMASKKKTINEINIQAIQEVARDIGALVKYTSNIKGKTAKLLKQTEKYKLETDGDLEEIRTALTNYQNKLMAAVSGIEDEREETLSVPHQVKSVSTR
jgi:hypothetical protein